MAFTLTYIGIWFLIPVLTMFILNIGLCSVSYLAEKESTEGNVKASMDGGPTVENDCDSIGWNDNIGIKFPSKDMNTMITYASKSSTLSPTGVVPKEAADIKSSPSSPPLLLIFISSLFIPCWFSSPANGDKTKNSKTKQINIFINQIIFINTCHFIILSIIFILVTSVPSFDYSSNILNFTMFKTVSLFLVIMGVLNIFLPMSISSNSSPPNDSMQRSISDVSLHLKQERITFHRGAIINGWVTCYAPFWKILELRMTLHHFALFWVPLIDFVLFHCDRKILTFALTYEVPKVKKEYFVTKNSHPIKQNRSSMFKLAKLEHPGSHSILPFLNSICKHLSSPTHLYSYCLFRCIEFGLHQV